MHYVTVCAIPLGLESFFPSYLRHWAQRATSAMLRMRKTTRETMPTSGDANQPNILTVPNGAIVPESSLGGEKTKQKNLATIGSGGLNVSFSIYD